MPSLLVVAAMCIVPKVVLLVSHQNLCAIFYGVCGFGFWCWLGRGTQEFPLLFDMLSFEVLLINSLGVLAALASAIDVVPTGYMILGIPWIYVVAIAGKRERNCGHAAKT